MNKVGTLFLSLFYVLPSYADPEVGKHVGGNIDAVTMILSLLMVLALIVVSAMLLKKFNLTVNHSSDLKIISTLALGAKEKIVVVQVGEQQLLLGVTAQNIRLLDSLDTPLEIKPANQQVTQHMASSLQKLLKKS